MHIDLKDEKCWGTGDVSDDVNMRGSFRPSCGFVPRVSSGAVKVREVVKAPQAEF